MTFLQSFGIMIIRGMVGFIMAYHGSQKLFGWFGGGGMEGFIGAVKGLKLPVDGPPTVMAYAAAITEFGGGLLLMFGLGTRFAAIGIACVMGVAAFFVHGDAFSNQKGGMEYPLTLGVVAIGLIFTGGGTFSLDRLFVRKAKRSVKGKD